MALFNGKDLSGLSVEPAEARDTFKVEDGILKVSSTPNGYVYTEKSYRNFVVRFEWRNPERPGNGGLLVYIRPPHKVWPKAVEVQGLWANHGKIFGTYGAKKTLICYNSPVTGFAPLKDVPLESLLCDFDPQRDAAVLRQVKTLKTFNDKPAAEVLK